LAAFLLRASPCKPGAGHDPILARTVQGDRDVVAPTSALTCIAPARISMWLEAIISQEDLVQVMGEFLPVKIHLDQEGKEEDAGKKSLEPERSLLLRAATQVSLVPDEGVRVICPAELTWSIAGMSPMMKLDELSVMIRPRVVEKNKGSVLEFALEVEEANFHALPAFLDNTIVKAVNAALATKKPAWDFTQTLTRTVGLGSMFDPVEALKIKVAWGKTKIGADVLGLVLSFKLGFVRTD
jgi:hypothetical protein